LAKQIKASLGYVQSMPSLDLAMPLALLLVVTVAMLLNKRIEGKLMATVEKKEFKTRDIILLVGLISIIISVLAYTVLLNPGAIVENVLLVMFLISYSTLLFTFSYLFSNVSQTRVLLLSLGFGLVSTATGVICLFPSLQDSFTVVRIAAFFGLAIFCFGVAFYEQGKNVIAKARWYMAVQPPAMFLFLFIFFNFIHNSGTVSIWAPFLMDVFGFTFAILIILYLSSLFSWKTVGIFAVLLTTMDIILVIGTPAMLTAANTFTGLGLPVLVYLPQFPLEVTAQGIAFRGLGLGDFFFAGVLAVQTLSKFGKKTAFISVVAMTVAFAIWEAFLRDIITWLTPILGRDIGGFPGTLMIISGWAPIVAWKLITTRNKTVKTPVAVELPQTPKEQSLPVTKNFVD
jgi:hypothetical protein